MKEVEALKNELVQNYEFTDYERSDDGGLNVGYKDVMITLYDDLTYYPHTLNIELTKEIQGIIIEAINAIRNF
ncbi:hypothetical protein [Pedobacter agri]|uniref:hypothetical protein n=1 Tax=Pedobacter agri TaxID=454586 RepID=UPI002930BB7D|nr:hypothetical protein [Pedobacter agri]